MRDSVFIASVFSVSSMSLQYRRYALCIIVYILTTSILTSAGESDAFVPCEAEVPIFQCKAEYGIIVFHEIAAKDASAATFHTGHYDVEVKAWIDEHQHIDVNCTLKIGEVEVQQTPVVVYTTTSQPVTMTNTNEYSSPLLCTANVSYAAVHPRYGQWQPQIDDIKDGGNIQFPTFSNQTDDPLELGYASQLRLGWTLIGPPGSIWELTITSLDLGSRQTNLNLSSTHYHKSQGDFLLVGPGSELLVHDEVMFYGSSTEHTIVTIHNPSCHVVFYGSYHERKAKGFGLHYRTLNVTNPTTRIPVTPTQAPPSDPAAHIWVPINGIDLLKPGNWTALLARFRKSIAAMANDYLDSSQPHQTVSSTDVDFVSYSQCIRQGCAATCTSFYFGISSIHIEDGKQFWLFNKHKLNDMVYREDLQNWFKNITSGSTHCGEFRQNWSGVIGLSVGLVVLVVAMSTMTWWIVGRRHTAKKTTKTAIQNKREEHERVRRSSSMLSKIGGGKVERKTSHPFQDLPTSVYGTSNATYVSADSALPEMYDYDEYKDFEVIFEDNFDRFVGEEVLADFSKSRTYTNTAFVDDEVDNTAE